MGKYVKIELVVPQDVVVKMKEDFGNKLTAKRLVKKVTDHEETTLNISIGPVTTTEGHDVCLEKILVQKVERYLTMADASKFGQADTSNAAGNPQFSGENPN